MNATKEIDEATMSAAVRLVEVFLTAANRHRLQLLAEVGHVPHTRCRRLAHRTERGHCVHFLELAGLTDRDRASRNWNWIADRSRQRESMLQRALRYSPVPHEGPYCNDRNKRGIFHNKREFVWYQIDLQFAIFLPLEYAFQLDPK